MLGVVVLAACRRALALAVRLVPLAALLLLGSCTGGTTPPPPPPRPPVAPYFSVDGKQQFVASRNISGRSVAEIETLLDKARDEGTRLVRFHVTHLGGLGITSAGEIVESWAASWDQVFARARADGISVIPVFGVWADWNDGSNGETWHAWDQNPLSTARGGPAASPLQLYTSGSAGQKAWLRWLGKLVARWQAYDNVAAWEVFSELDLVTRGNLADESFRARGIGFVEAAAAVVRAQDPSHRPVTASLSQFFAWTELYFSDGIDLVQLHLYSPGPNLVDGLDLDAAIMNAVTSLRSLSFTPTKPVFIGESGLDWRAPDGSTATTSPEGPRATRHAVWAALVSGAMNGRALWWEDGYDILQNGDAGVPFVTGYPAVEQGALELLGGRDLTGLQPLVSSFNVDVLHGGVIGDETVAFGWVRTRGCGSPDWSCSTPVEGEAFLFEVPGSAAGFQVTFHDTTTGAAVGEPIVVSRDGAYANIPLPPFSDDLAFELTAQP